jgi:AcrR family transcriptional regulator
MARTQAALLDASLEVFSRHGLSGSTKEIAELAGIAETTLFRAYPTKRDLFIAAFRHGIELFYAEELFEDKLLVRDFRTGVRKFAESLFTRMRTKHGAEYIRIMTFAALEDPDLIAAYVQSHGVPLATKLGAYIELAIERGECKHPRPYVAARVLIDSLRGAYVFLDWYGAGRLPLFNCARPFDQVVDIWLNGLNFRKDLPARKV